jgi:hypothetical protein
LCCAFGRPIVVRSLWKEASLRGHSKVALISIIKGSQSLKEKRKVSCFLRKKQVPVKLKCGGKQLNDALSTKEE